MSTEQAREFIREVMANESLEQELEDRLNFTGTEETLDGADTGEVRETLASTVPEIAAEHGYDFTAEEGFEALRTIQEKSDAGELSDAELERVAGGKTTNHKKNAVSMFSIGVACTVSFAQDVHEAGTCFTDDL